MVTSSAKPKASNKRPRPLSAGARGPSLKTWFSHTTRDDGRSPKPSPPMGPGSRFAECPLCFGTFHITLLQAHAEGCTGPATTSSTTTSRQVVPPASAAAAAAANAAVQNVVATPAESAPPAKRQAQQAASCGPFTSPLNHPTPPPSSLARPPPAGAAGAAAAVATAAEGTATKGTTGDTSAHGGGDDDDSCVVVTEDMVESTPVATPKPEVTERSTVKPAAYHADSAPLRAEEDTPISQATKRQQGPSAAAPPQDAFARLREASRRHFRREVFTLCQTEGGKLTWKWGSGGGGKDRGGICWEVEFKHPLHKDGTLILRTNIPPSTTTSVAQHWKPSGLSTSFLKSALQKNIRMSRAVQAMRVALELLLRAPEELYRRMVIIIFEDAILHPPALVLHVWLIMAHSKGYRASRSLHCAVLATVLEVGLLTRTDWDNDVYSAALDQVRDDAVLDTEFIDRSMSAEAATLVRCILTRKAYGGMGGDLHMLRSLAKAWVLRLNEKAGEAPRCSMGKGDGSLAIIIRPPPKRVEGGAGGAGGTGTQAVEPLFYVDDAKIAEYQHSEWLRFLMAEIRQCNIYRKIDDFAILAAKSQVPIESSMNLRLRPPDIPLSACDFHVSNVIDDIVAKRLNETERQNIVAILRTAGLLPPSASSPSEAMEQLKRHLQRAMWWFSSSRTDKIQVTGYRRTIAAGAEKDGPLHRAWKMIEGQVKSYAQATIDRRFASG